MDVRLIKRVDKLPGLGTAIRREAQKFTEEQAKAVVTQAQANIKERGAYRTGKMHDSGKAVPAGNDAWRVVFASDEVDYAAYVHEGYTHRGGTFVTGRPFLTTAMESERAKLPAAVKAALKRAVT